MFLHQYKEKDIDQVVHTDQATSNTLKLPSLSLFEHRLKVHFLGADAVALGTLPLKIE